MIIPLTKPINTPDGEITELNLSDDLTIGQLKGIRLETIGDPATVIMITSRWAGIPPSFIEKIHAKDHAKLVEAAADFLGISQETGES